MNVDAILENKQPGLPKEPKGLWIWTQTVASGVDQAAFCGPPLVKELGEQLCAWKLQAPHPALTEALFAADASTHQLGSWVETLEAIPNYQRSVSAARLFLLAGHKERVDQFLIDGRQLLGPSADQHQKARCIARLGNHAQTLAHDGLISVQAAQHLFGHAVIAPNLRQNLSPYLSILAALDAYLNYKAAQQLHQRLQHYPQEAQLDQLRAELSLSHAEHAVCSKMAYKSQNDDLESGFTVHDLFLEARMQIIQAKQRDLQAIVGETAMRIFDNAIQADQACRPRYKDARVMTAFHQAFSHHRNQLQLEWIASSASAGTLIAAPIPMIGTTLSVALQTASLGARGLHLAGKLKSQPSTSVVIPPGDEMV